MSSRPVITVWCLGMAAIALIGCHRPHHGESPPAVIVAAGDSSSFVSTGRQTVVLGSQYAAGAVKRWLFGTQYREVWTTPMDVPVIDLDRTAGGLTPFKIGGGQQSISLRMRGADNLVYELRSVHKDAGPTTPASIRDGLIGRLVQDQASSLNPLGVLILPTLSEAAGILHLRPALVVVPDSPRLGPFRARFAGMPALFERRPDEDQSDAARFGYAKNVVGTEKLFEELTADPRNRVDQRAYVRARLFDMLIGDWDRHEGQWRWAEYETIDGARFVPIPVDRDFAFAKFDGVVNRIMRHSGKMKFRRLVDFTSDMPDVLGLNWQGLWLDRRLTANLEHDVWIAIADSLRLAVTDEVIDRAVREWPEEVYDMIGPATAENLRARRDRLPAVASAYFEILVDEQQPDRHTN